MYAKHALTRQWEFPLVRGGRVSFQGPPDTRQGVSHGARAFSEAEIGRDLLIGADTPPWNSMFRSQETSRAAGKKGAILSSAGIPGFDRKTRVILGPSVLIVQRIFINPKGVDGIIFLFIKQLCSVETVENL